MKIPKVKISSSIPADLKGSTLVIGVVKDGENLRATGPAANQIPSTWNLKGIGASAKHESVTRVPSANGGAILLVGLGDGVISPDEARNIGGALGRSAKTESSLTLAFGFESEALDAAVLEGTLLGHYEFNDYRGRTHGGNSKLSRIDVVSGSGFSAADANAIAIVSEAVHNTRDLTALPPNVLYPKTFAKIAEDKAAKHELGVRIWDEKAMAKDGIVGIHAVGQGSTRGPRFVRIDYQPKGAKKSLALVGKGITFDSGGLSLKPPASMLTMKGDMMGAAAVLESLIAIARLKLKVNVTGWLCIAENLPSGSATRPSDVIRYRNGVTVEVTNTDAEGRVVLADGLISASIEDPDLLVDVATLTGAATYALGNRYSGLMGEESAVEAVKRASAETGELFWHMPLPAELRANLDSQIADMVNSKLGTPDGGMLVGGLFLKEFVGVSKRTGKSIPWAHLDIASADFNTLAPFGFTPKGPTGVSVRMLVQLARNLASQK